MRPGSAGSDQGFPSIEHQAAVVPRCPTPLNRERPCSPRIAPTCPLQAPNPAADASATTIRRPFPRSIKLCPHRDAGSHRNREECGRVSPRIGEPIRRGFRVHGRAGILSADWERACRWRGGTEGWWTEGPTTGSVSGSSGMRTNHGPYTAAVSVQKRPFPQVP